MRVRFNQKRGGSTLRQAPGSAEASGASRFDSLRSLKASSPRVAGQAGRVCYDRQVENGMVSPEFRKGGRGGSCDSEKPLHSIRIIRFMREDELKS
jgi:hypothetical protein